MSQATPEEGGEGIEKVKQWSAEFDRSIEWDHYGVLFSYCIARNKEEAMKLAEKLGVPAAALREALLQSSAANWALEVQAQDNPMPWAEKDMTIVLKEAYDAQLSLPLCGVVKEVIKGIKLDQGQGIPRPRARDGG